MSALVGMLIGAMMGVGLVTLIVSAFAFKQDEPFHRASKTVLAAVTFAVVLSLFGNGFDPLFQGMYIIGGCLIWPILYRHYKKNWTNDEPSDIFR